MLPTQALARRPVVEVGVLDRAPAHVVVEVRQQRVGVAVGRAGRGTRSASLPNCWHDLAPHRLGGAGGGDADALGRRQRGLVVALDDDVGRGVEPARRRSTASPSSIERPGRDVVGEAEVRRGVREPLAERERTGQVVTAGGDLAGQVRRASSSQASDNSSNWWGSVYTGDLLGAVGARRSFDQLHPEADEARVRAGRRDGGPPENGLPSRRDVASSSFLRWPGAAVEVGVLGHRRAGRLRSPRC